MPRLKELILGYNIEIMESDCIYQQPGSFDFENLVAFKSATEKEANETTLAWTVILDNILDVQVMESDLEVSNHEMKEIVIAELTQRSL